jgi:hypothetical protein
VELPRRQRSFVLQFLGGDPFCGASTVLPIRISSTLWEHAMTIDNQDNDTRLYLGPARNAAFLEVVTIVRDDGSEIAIHAMEMRAKYRRLLSGG